MRRKQLIAGIILISIICLTISSSIYAHDYSGEKLRYGMTQSEVIAAVGYPSKKYLPRNYGSKNTKSETWEYDFYGGPRKVSFTDGKLTHWDG
jgi:hypothetical protein